MILLIVLLVAVGGAFLYLIGWATPFFEQGR